MDVVKQSELAQALYRAHGDRAEVEAARRKRMSLDAGDAAEAENWQSIQDRIRQLRGAHQG
jgi:hypothetical protein